jgi:hypothetical protein
MDAPWKLMLLGSWFLEGVSTINFDTLALFVICPQLFQLGVVLSSFIQTSRPSLKA